MQTTFALRRQTIVMFLPTSENSFLDLWPALRMQSEVFAEFQRINYQNLSNTFYAELIATLPRFDGVIPTKGF
ncbi:unnamed protein product [Pleuronectes platessa]|uniref:Uncharacterized protein n=1 Tax=Pleuronectes platessa TaxID=8262 RepID=A0A9N7UY45_PLEPL|nr:unnamed protein product [Pleuronectes platessa]